MSTSPLPEHIGLSFPYVLPATILSDEPTHDGDPSSLRADASHDGTCYLQISRSLGDGTYLARVAAFPEALHAHGYTVMVNRTQLAEAHADYRPLPTHA